MISDTKTLVLLRSLVLKGGFIILPFLLLIYSVNNLYQINVEATLRGKEQILGVEVKKERQSLPTRLVIPKLNIDAKIQQLGIARDGSMDVPSNASDAGWYRLGPIPGEVGEAVIAGHFDEREGKAGVFNNLSKLAAGDQLFVIDNKGIFTTFVVQESRTYDPGYANEVFVSDDGGKHLNLITCDGVWNETRESYSKRLVVFTDKL